MRLEDEKIEQFTNDIMANVALKRQKVLAGVDKDIERIYKEKETELYTEAYKVIQAGMKEIDREKNEISSKVLMDNRIQLFHKRAEIIEAVFNKVRNQLRDFCKTPEYYDYLVKIIHSDLKLLEAGEKEIVINYSDRDLKERLEKDFDACVTIEHKQIDFIGGCKIVDREHKLFIDDSFEQKLIEQKDDFMLMCDISIES